ncbi:hypothetical protein GCM10020331_054140 [Ectobacillus funiculus]
MCMEHLDVIIINGKAVLPAGVVETDIGIKDGKIAVIKKRGYRMKRISYGMPRVNIFFRV